MNHKSKPKDLLGTEMPCGCRLGFHLCPTAERLFGKAGTIYEDLYRPGSRLTWADYEAAMAEYRAHFSEVIR